MHPYVAAMSTTLAATAAQTARIPVISKAMSLFKGGKDDISDEELQKAKAKMNQVGQEIIDARRSNPVKKNDFLNMLLFGKDPKTGESMRDDLIKSQMQSFLTAGHETTSGMLSFTVIMLLQNPETWRRAQEEVDRIVGDSSVSLQHVRDLKSIWAVLQESLRLIPTAPLISKVPHPRLENEVVTLGGKYKIEHTDRVRILFGKSMCDPSVFGKDAGEYKPERMLESNPDYTRLEKYWRPFPEGSRACLGRPFSLQEAVLALTLILQNFDLRLTDPMYKMRVKHNITIKPLGLSVKAALRKGMTPVDLEQRLHTGGSGPTKQKVAIPRGSSGQISGRSAFDYPIWIKHRDLSSVGSAPCF